MRDASFPKDEFTKLARQVATSNQAKLDNPTTLAIDAMSRHFRTYPEGDA